MLSKLIKLWQIAADDLGLDIVHPYSLILPSGARVEALFLVRHFGANKGMLIIDNYRTVDCHIDELASEGYGFSVLGEPSEHEEYSQQDFIDLLIDWGWSGNKLTKPEWLTKN